MRYALDNGTSPAKGRWRKSRLLVLALAGTALVAGCDKSAGPSNPGKGLDVGFLPSTRNMTNHTSQLIDLWNGAWTAAMLVGVLVWSLMIWCMIVYRKRKNDDQLPVQLRYHVPLELMYTFVPVIMIGAMWVATAQSTRAMTDVSEEPDVYVEIYGKQWTWDFNYLGPSLEDESDDVFFSGERIALTGEEGVEATLPTLYLPVNKNVEFIIKSRDVAHAFWVPAFLFKVDMLPGRVNRFQLVPQEEGVYSGKCAELCGEYHSEMIFNVAVVSEEEYEAHLNELREAGNIGRRGDEYNRQYLITKEDSE